MPITTVIFDYGCVLSVTPRLEDYEPLRQATGLDAAAFQETYWRHRDAYDGDATDVSAYWQDFGLAMGVTFSPEQIQELVAKDIQIWARTDRVMIEWARVLRQRGWKTAVLSNMSRSVGDYLRRTAKWLELFDHLCFSGELRITKPGAAIYHVCLEALGVPAGEALFVDDLAVNIAAAQAIGMHGIVFQSAGQLMKELEPYGLAESLAEAKAVVGRFDGQTALRRHLAR
jgi:putative hydrolase of the HAD superfamily